MGVIEGEVALADGGAAEHAHASSAVRFIVKAHHQFVAARADLEEAAFVQALLVQAFGQQDAVVGEWQRQAAGLNPDRPEEGKLSAGWRPLKLQTLVEELDHGAHARHPLLHMRHVAGVLEQRPADPGDQVQVRLDYQRRGLVIAPGDQQARHVDPRQAVDDGPVLGAADDVKFVGPGHRVVHGRVGLHLGEGACHLFRPGLEPAHVAVVEHLGGGDVVGRGVVAHGFVAQQGFLDVLGQLFAQAVGLAHPGAHVGRRVGDHQAAQAPGLAHRVFAGEHTAPGLAQQCVALADAQVLKQVVELIQEQLHRPERRRHLRQVGGTAVAQLVVVDDRVATGGDIFIGIDIVVGAARAAVQDDERGAATGQVAGDAVPGLVFAKGGKTFTRLGEFHFIRLHVNHGTHDIPICNAA
ncbi:hypothetical protein WR25_25886 [Diploscapter pachys]|uniref:Uncharacterized protein n=1 Tax=Diploscapter pachys TaxID=2018661 RepID=A0A2A2K5U4_9BILA|nr:hypothetical protein WR25_25886 [Diploscapter pachys]